jgi:thiamine transport system ATP-binding protein
MLQLDGLVLAAGDFRLGADWSVPQGALVAVIGPSGAGKSTLLLALAGFLAPTQGRILWDGHEITGLPPAQRPVAMLFQDQNLFPHLTVAQNLGLALNPGLRLTAADHARIDAVLDRLGLSGMGNRKPGALSGGQSGRAALARVLLQDRPILLLDEPFAALGPALKADLLTLVADLAQETGKTVLLVTHDPADARRLAGLTVLVADGLASPPEPTAALFAHPPRALKDYLGPQG